MKEKPTIIVILGPPGAGKGTQAKILSENIGVPHISSGDIFRENIHNQTELGKMAESFMKNGELVPDDITIEMVRGRFSRQDCDAGVILDGFPRTSAQAKSLDAMLQECNVCINIVPVFHLPVEKLIRRLTGRRTCKKKGHVFNIELNPPKVEGICDYDGSELYQRTDDQEATVTNRIHIYHGQTIPLIEYYQRRGLVRDIDASKSIDEVTSQLLSMVNH